MAGRLIRARRPGAAVELDKVFVPECHKNAVSRVRETGHAPYRCTRSYKTSDRKDT